MTSKASGPSSSSSSGGSRKPKISKGEGKRERKDKPALSLVSDRCQQAVASLLNTAFIDTKAELSAVKGGKTAFALSDSQKINGYDHPGAIPVVVFDAAVLAGMRTMLGSATYTFCVNRANSITSGAAVLNVTIQTDLTMYLEGAALIALFEECLMTRTSLQVSGIALNTYNTLIGFEPIANTTAPTQSTVVRMPGSINTSCNMGVFTRPLTLTARIKQPRPWGLTSDEGVSTPRIAAGCAGNWNFANYTAFPPATSQLYYTYIIRSIVKLRNRA